jgi:PAS domain S-box-containing protein
MSARPLSGGRSARDVDLEHAVNDDQAGPGGELARSRLPRVLHEAPAAVLLVDLATSTVVLGNPAGRALAPTGLPAPIAGWVDGARLRRPGGQPYDAGTSPLERVAAGRTVHGEPVWLEVDDGWRAVWVTAFPVPATGAEEQVLVALLEVDGLVGAAGDMASGDMAASEADVRDRAVVAAGLAFTISDPRLPDNPLVFVNPAFERATGYAADEVLHRNCRFLQGPDTDPQAVAAVRALIEDQRHGSVTLLNYRKDGTAFWNELSLSPVHDGAGRLTHYVGIQADVTPRVLAEQEREQHLAAERAARADAERAQRRLALLAEATSMLAATLDVDESLSRLTHLVVPLMSDWCTVHLVDPDGGVQRVAAASRDASKADLLHRVQELLPDGLSPQSATVRVLRGGPPELVPHVTPEMLAAALSPELAGLYEQIGVSSAIVVPMRARRQVLGALTLFTDGSGRVFEEADLDTAADLARRAALTVDNARLYQREHDVAEALQRSLLPQLPAVPGLDRAARYLPGSTAAQVGGDWYDLFRLPDGTVGIAIGDVMGHDLTAAASMGQLRSVLQSYAWQGSSPAVVLDRLDQLVQGLAMAQLATCLYGRLELPSADGAPGRLRLSNAGHLPPVLRCPQGSVRLLDEGVSLLVGAALGTDRQEVEEELPPGSLLVLYTDGLVEHRGRDLDEGLEALVAAVADAPGDSAEAVCDHLLARLTDASLDDDVAVLVVRVLDSP